jgi:PEP-CTERM motif
MKEIMKKLMLSNCLLAAVALSVVSSSATAPAQGTVIFQNDSRGLVYSWQGTNDPTPALGVPNVQIAYAPAGTTYVPWYPQWNTTDWLARNPGWTMGPSWTNRLGINKRGMFAAGTITLDGVAAGSEAEYIIFAWEGDSPTFDQNFAVNGLWYNVAGPFTTLTGGNGQPAVSLADSFTGMTIPWSLAVPEPSSFALALLGGGALVALRRKRRPRC